MIHESLQLKLLEKNTAGVSYLCDVRSCLNILSEYLDASGYALATFQPNSSRQHAEGGSFGAAQIIYSTLDEDQERRYLHAPLRVQQYGEACDAAGPHVLTWSPAKEGYFADGTPGLADEPYERVVARCIAMSDAALNFATIIMCDTARVEDVATDAVWRSFGSRLAKETLKLCGPANPVNLSDREKQCLLWCSRGKTSSDIATILGLSDHTVNHYLTSAALKLNAVNRTHAIAKALRYGIIPLHDL